MFVQVLRDRQNNAEIGRSMNSPAMRRVQTASSSVIVLVELLQAAYRAQGFSACFVAVTSQFTHLPSPVLSNLIPSPLAGEGVGEGVYPWVT